MRVLNRYRWSNFSVNSKSIGEIKWREKYPQNNKGGWGGRNNILMQD